MNSVGESLAKTEEILQRRMSRQLIQVPGRVPDPLEESGSGENRRRREGLPESTNEDRPGQRVMLNPSERWDSGADPDLEPGPKNRRNSPEATSSEVVGQVGRLDRGGSWPIQKTGHGERGGQCPGGARTEALTDRQGVQKVDIEMAPTIAQEVDRRILRDFEPTPNVARQSQSAAGLGIESANRAYTDLQYDPRADRAASPRISRFHRGRKDPRDVRRGERHRPTHGTRHHGRARRPLAERLLISRDVLRFPSTGIDHCLYRRK